MAHISIQKFSCVSKAELEITDINIFIGEQGSGKSVVAKLIYFFGDIFSDFIRSAEDQVSFEQYKKELSRRFIGWFPAAAWGNEKFQVSFKSGECTFRIMRRVRRGTVTDEVAFTSSQWFAAIYEEALSAFSSAKNSAQIFDENNDSRISHVLEAGWRTRANIRNMMSSQLGQNFIIGQTFIPAGRAFFTSIGRLVAGIEQGSALDPVTHRFARLFASWRDSYHISYENVDKSFYESRDRAMNDLFGGRVSSKRDAEVIEMGDGRKVPFAFLSSGQQELIPIWFYLNNLLRDEAMFAARSSSRRIRQSNGYHMVYIEEPEAHLFPRAQARLLDYLISSVLNERKSRRLILTTHSPYVMTRMNVYLKAGQLARRKKRNHEISEIIPRECWIGKDQLNAWAIREGEFLSLRDPEGLIDADYLDSISEIMAQEFDELLDVESSMP